MAQTINNLSQTWNDAGTTFSAIKFNVTDTASNAASLLMDLQVGGVSKFAVNKNGAIAIAENQQLNLNGSFSTAAGASIKAVSGTDVRFQMNGKLRHHFANGTIGFIGGDGKGIEWRDTIHGTTEAYAGQTGAAIRSYANNTIDVINSTNAQTFRIYNTYTDASNYERLKFGWSGNVFELKPENAGTGSARVIHISGLPTSNPGAGILWNNGGTVEVGT